MCLCSTHLWLALHLTTFAGTRSKWVTDVWPAWGTSQYTRTQVLVVAVVTDLLIVVRASWRWSCRALPWLEVDHFTQWGGVANPGQHLRLSDNVDLWKGLNLVQEGVECLEGVPSHEIPCWSGVHLKRSSVSVIVILKVVHEQFKPALFSGRRWVDTCVNLNAWRAILLLVVNFRQLPKSWIGVVRADSWEGTERRLVVISERPVQWTVGGHGSIVEEVTLIKSCYCIRAWDKSPIPNSVFGWNVSPCLQDGSQVNHFFRQL